MFTRRKFYSELVDWPIVWIGLWLVFMLLLWAESAVAQQQITGVQASSSGPATLTTQFSSACVQGTSCTTTSLGGYAAVSVQVKGTWAGTLTFQVTLDDPASTAASWVSQNLTPTTGTATPVSTTTGNGVWAGSVVARGFRVVFTTRSSGSAVVTTRSTIGAAGGLGGGGSGSVPGSDTQVIFNDGGAFGAEADFTWNKTTNALRLGQQPLITGIANSAVSNEPSVLIYPASGIQSSLTVASAFTDANTWTGLNIWALNHSGIITTFVDGSSHGDTSLTLDTGSGGITLNAAGGSIITSSPLIIGNGKSIRSDTIVDHTAIFEAYDTDTGPGYVTFATLTNGTAPSFVLSAPAGGATLTVTPTTLTIPSGTSYTGGTATALFVANGASPSVDDTSGGNSCGTAGNPSMGANSTNNAGAFNVGLGGGTDCTVTFTVAAPHLWACTPSDETSAVLVRAVSINTTTTKFQGVLGAADVVRYVCVAY